jgi:hypothetical protein
LVSLVAAWRRVCCSLRPAARHVAALAEEPGAGGRGHDRAPGARALIISGQMAVACALLVGAALLTRSFGALLDAERGYDPADVLTAALLLPEDASRRGARHADDHAARRLHAVPGVTHAAFTMRCRHPWRCPRVLPGVLGGAGQCGRRR